MAGEKRSYFDFKIIIGLLILIFGILLLLQNVGVDIGMRIWSFWPIILIILGLRIMFQPWENRQLITGGALAILGVLLLLRNLEVIRFGWGIIWPIIIILVGISILRGRIRQPEKQRVGQDYIDLSMVLGGGEFKFDSKELRGGRVSAILGGGNIDLRDADMATDEIVVDAFALMGGIEFRVPTSWQVILHATPILGGAGNKTYGQVGDTQAAKIKKLIVTGTAIMGGIEVKN
jgi:predicted membrane protein